MIVVFTGTRRGMKAPQLQAVAALLQRAGVLFHGCCHGADTECHTLARQVRGAAIRIEGFPGNFAQLEACTLDIDVWHSPPTGPSPELQRNRQMIAIAQQRDETMVVAAPGLFSEELRSRTWATVRHARKRKVWRRIVWPDGRVDQDYS